MLDFPSPATNGQLFAAGGMTWRYDGTKWSETAGTLALADAPSDGNTYGRRNTAWNSVDAMLAPVAANANAALNDSGRSLIHNGQFTVQQRGTGPWTANGNWTADRWNLFFSGGTASVTIVTLVDADRTAIGDESAKYALQAVITGGAAAANNTGIYETIEGVQRTSGKTITVSFWAKASTAALKIGVSPWQRFGTGGSAGAGINGTAVTPGTTWSRQSVTFAVPSAIGKTVGTQGDDCLELDFYMSSGSTGNATAGGIGVQSGTFTIYGVQCEYGSVATPLARRDAQQELALCQRFFYTSTFVMWSYSSAGQAVGQTQPLPVTMRAPPTFVLSGQVYNNCSGAAVNTSSTTMVAFTATVTATGQASFLLNYTASADL